MSNTDYNLGKTRQTPKTILTASIIGILSVLTLCFSQNFAQAKLVIVEPEPEIQEETEEANSEQEEEKEETRSKNSNKKSEEEDEVDEDLTERLKQAQERALAKKAEEEILEKSKKAEENKDEDENESKAVLTEEDYERIRAEIVSELQNAENEKTEPLGVTENLEKVEDEEGKNQIITIICIVVIAISIIGIATIILLPFFRKDKKRNAKIKF